MAAHLFLACTIFTGAVAPGSASESPPAVEFNRDIRPILSDNCFSCHGPDHHMRKARLRLDRNVDLLERQILVPCQPLQSELFQRISQTEPAGKMPPARTNKSLTQKQVDLIRLWIEQGAKYQGHWAFLPPGKSPPPSVKDSGWPRNPIDHFILARLENQANGLAPSAEADRRTLIRRLSFDLLGLPPTSSEVDAFSADASQAAYEMLVERLLASPHFGERLAQQWLDLVRYADSNGYFFDEHREAYLYRDWVIAAFNRNMPFDQFTREQLAGDLLPAATPAQRIASGYNHLLKTTGEVVAQAREFQAKYDADRVRNFAAVWLGLTMGCCECHDHKFDPITTKEFYQLAAFFADIQQNPLAATAYTPINPDGPDEYELAGQRIKKTEDRVLATRTRRDSWKQKLVLLAGSILIMPFAWFVAAVGALIKCFVPMLLVRTLDANILELRAQKEHLAGIYPKAIVTVSGTPHTIRTLPRGNWLDESGEIVAPATPAVLAPLTVRGGRRPSRLDLARWVTAEDNPLPARVFVNRLWTLFFGRGLVATLDDFGAQGSWPTHPELLDWLAVEFRESHWDVKHMIRLMVLSRTYRQTSTPGPAHKRDDPGNAFLARQGRFRLDAEMIRDNALRVSGLLAAQVGGRSVKPYQPHGYWENAKGDWTTDSGDNLYRRGLYTYWKRSFLHPSLLIFDASSREECAVARLRSNTPQQALVLLNDPIYVEAARAFAGRIMGEGGASVDERLRFAVREGLQRPALPEEMKILGDLFAQHLAEYRDDRGAAAALLSVGTSAVPSGLDVSELAAWTSVAQVILNLPESITRY